MQPIHVLTFLLLIGAVPLLAQQDKKATAAPPSTTLVPPIEEPKTDPPLEVKKANAKASSEEVKKPLPFTEQEMRVLNHATTMPVPRLVELMQVYEKLGNESMLQILVRQVIKRDPTNEEALRVSAALSPDEEVRPANYLEILTKELRTVKKVNDPEGIATLARSFLSEGHAYAAVDLLEALRRGNYANQPFPFEDDLAAAYHDAGDFDKAEATWKSLLANPASEPGDRQSAQEALNMLGFERRLAVIRKDAEKDPEKSLAMATTLMKERPSDPLVLDLYIDCLALARKNQQSVTFLEGIKTKSGKSFAYQSELADAYLGQKNYAKASELYRAIAADPQAAPDDRANAEKMIASVRQTQLLERGTSALSQGRLKETESILAQLDAEFPGNEDALGLRGLWLTKTGRADDGLLLLLNNRQQAARQKKLFTQMDALADVYMERKEYNLAKSAYEDILVNPAYDAEMVAEAWKGLEEVQKQSLMDEVSRALAEGNPAKARELLPDLATMSPGDPDVLLLEADINLATGHPREAYERYASLKERYYKHVPFPGQSGLADALQKLGRWEEAMIEIDEVINGPGYDLDETWDAKWDRRALLPYLKQHAAMDLTFTDEADGSVLRQTATYATPWWKDWRAIVRERVNYVTLEDAANVLKDSSSVRGEGEVLFQRRLGDGYFVEAGIGGSEDDVLYSARVGRFETSSIYWSLGFEGNAQATDSLALEALNGRQNRVEFKAGGYLQPRLRFDAGAYLDWINVGGEKLGHGYGFNGSLDYVIQAETRQKPEFTVGYFGEYTRFKKAGTLPQKVIDAINPASLQVQRALSVNDEVRAALPTTAELKKALASDYGNEIFDTLVAAETNRHGVQFTVSKRIENVSLYAQAGPYYDFEGSSVEFQVTVGVEYWVNEQASVYAELMYDSEGRAGGSGSGVWEGRVGAEINF